jgi:hypothetical protein
MKLSVTATLEETQYVKTVSKDVNTLQALHTMPWNPALFMASYPIYLNDVLGEDTQFECK